MLAPMNRQHFMHIFQILYRILIGCAATTILFHLSGKYNFFHVHFFRILFMAFTPYHPCNFTFCCYFMSHLHNSGSNREHCVHFFVLCLLWFSCLTFSNARNFCCIVLFACDFFLVVLSCFQFKFWTIRGHIGMCIFYNKCTMFTSEKRPM